ncbi:hypothetical protein FRC02_007607 [Tulasnella sp. 418]|nr:hypothetical protein FRC02_007607 [Tulasnella sp. 418]
MDDADLYGDLYGADEYDDDVNGTSTTKPAAEAAKPVEPPKDVKSEAKDLKEPANGATSATADVSKPAAASTPPSAPAMTKPAPAQLEMDQAATAPQPIQSIAGTSSIPTYSSSDDYSAYSQLNSQQNGSNYAVGQDFDRGDNHTVRPSEMRDEG